MSSKLYIVSKTTQGVKNETNNEKIRDCFSACLCLGHNRTCCSLCIQLVFSIAVLSPTLRILLALLPLIPGGLFLFSLVKGIRGLDELQQRIYTETATLTFIVTILMTFLYGSLQRAGLYSAKWDDIGNTMMFVWVCIYLLNDWRYR